MVDKTIERLVMCDNVKISEDDIVAAGEEGLKGELVFKYGGDGASAQAHYKLPFQKKPEVQEDGGDGEDSEETDEDEEEEVEERETPKSDAAVWTSTMVPIGLKVGSKWVKHENVFP